MNGRRVTALDRVVLTVLGVLLVVAGGLLLAAGAGWTRGTRVGAVALAPSDVDLGAARTAVSAGWWAGACAAAAVVLLGLGAAWVVAHLPDGRVPDLAVSGSRTGDRLRVVPDAVARAAQDRLEADPRVRGARLAVRRDRGVLVLDGAVRVDPRVDLPEVASLVDQVVHDAGLVLGTELAGRIRVRVGRRATGHRVLA